MVVPYFLKFGFTVKLFAWVIVKYNTQFFFISEFVLSKELIDETLKQCLLDPGFPALVGQVENLLINIEEGD